MKIGLRYIKGIPSDEDLQNIHSTFSNNSIEFDKYDISGHPQNSSTDLVALIAIYISSDFFISYTSGVLSALTFETIKSAILHIWNKVSNKKATMLQSGNKITEEPIDVDIQLELENSRKLSIRLGHEVSDDLKKLALDKAFEAIKNNQIVKGTDYKVLLDSKTFSWEFYTIHEFINKYLRK